MNIFINLQEDEEYIVCILDTVYWAHVNISLAFS